jgi:hypothetical protein
MTPTPTQEEAVARAIMHDDWSGTRTWEASVPSLRERYLDFARAAIAAYEASKQSGSIGSTGAPHSPADGLAPSREGHSADASPSAEPRALVEDLRGMLRTALSACEDYLDKPAPILPATGGDVHALYHTPIPPAPSVAAYDVITERRRQVTAEGWTLEHDDAQAAGELAAAAACYALGSKLPVWPWHAKWWKPSRPRRNLVRAAALIIAEIERLDRANARTPT